MKMASDNQLASAAMINDGATAISRLYSPLGILSRGIVYHHPSYSEIAETVLTAAFAVSPREENYGPEYAAKLITAGANALSTSYGQLGILSRGIVYHHPSHAMIAKAVLAAALEGEMPPKPTPPTPISHHVRNWISRVRAHGHAPKVNS
jgi:hypothetical protein